MRFLVRGIVPCCLTGSEELYCQTQCGIAQGRPWTLTRRSALLPPLSHSLLLFPPLLSHPHPRGSSGLLCLPTYLTFCCPVCRFVFTSHASYVWQAPIRLIKGKTLLCLPLFPQRLYNAPGIWDAGWKQGRSAPRDDLIV